MIQRLVDNLAASAGDSAAKAKILQKTGKSVPEEKRGRHYRAGPIAERSQQSINLRAKEESLKELSYAPGKVISGDRGSAIKSNDQSRLNSSDCKHGTSSGCAGNNGMFSSGQTNQNISISSDAAFNKQNTEETDPNDYADDFESDSDEDPECARPPPPAYEASGLNYELRRNSESDDNFRARPPSAQSRRLDSNFTYRPMMGDMNLPEASSAVRRGSDINRKATSESSRNMLGRGGGRGNVPNVSQLMRSRSPMKTESTSDEMRTARSRSTGRGQFGRNQSAESTDAPHKSPHSTRSSRDASATASHSTASLTGRASSATKQSKQSVTSSTSHTVRSTSVGIAEQRAKLEQRACERKERVMSLQQQAEERVNSKAREKEVEQR